MRIAVGNKIAAGFAATLLVMAVIGAYAYRSTMAFVGDSERAEHSRRVLGELKELLSLAQDLELGSRGYVITGKEEYLEPYRHASSEIGRQLATLSNFVADSPEQRTRLESLKPLVEQKLQRGAHIANVRDAEGFQAASAQVQSGTGKRIMDDIRRSVAEMEASENEALVRQDAKAQLRGRQTVAVVGIGSTFAVLVVGAAGVIIHRDLTRRRRVEAERDGFFTLSLDLLSIADPEGRFKRLNPAWEALGYTSDELAAKAYVEFVHPEDREATLRETRKLAAGAETSSFENRYRCKDGSYRWLLWKARLSPDGRSIYATARDVTDQKRSEAALREAEQRLRLLVDGVKDYAVIMLDLRGNVASWNAGAERLKGYGAGEIVGSHFSRFYTPEDLEQGKPERELKTAVEKGRYEEEGWRVRKDGSRFWANVVITAVRDESGALRGFAKVSRDVTERKRAEDDIRSLNETLRQHATRLDAANKELESFSYSVSHDLRAPLRSIDGFSQALLEDYADKLDAEGKNSLERVRAATQRMGQLIDDMLNLSRVTRSEMSTRRVDLSEMARAVAAELQKSQPDRAVEFVIADGLNDEGDPHLLRIVLDNLLGNAWKFTSKRTNARVEFGVVQDARGRAYFVRDNGAGFNMEFSHKLFGAFQRLHAMTDFGGTGVGLATVQRIVHRHGGRVWAEGAVDQGATFYFSLSMNAARLVRAA
jgi:PAS domain S-box-containing protein